MFVQREVRILLALRVCAEATYPDSFFSAAEVAFEIHKRMIRNDFAPDQDAYKDLMACVQKLPIQSDERNTWQTSLMQHYGQ